jgi:hypothetical protein
VDLAHHAAVGRIPRHDRPPDQAVARQVVALIAVASLCRLVLAGSLGLGVDESYAFAVARPFSLSYFDHPPLAFWIVGAARQLGTSPLLLRAPFVGLFAATTWLLFRTTALLFDQRAGYWSVAVISLSPVFTISSASWILPDGPLLLGLTLATYAAAKIRFRDDAPGIGDWSILGLGVGIAALAKYHAVLFVAGLALWVATDRGARRCIQPRGLAAAIGVALALSLPVVIWNAQHEWASVRFQLARVGGAQRPLDAVAQNLAGQAAYLLPWIWLPMLATLFTAGRRGPRDPRSWFLFCIAIVPIALFTLASLRGNPGLPHWPAPGYFFLAPLVGRAIARLAATRSSATMRRAFAVGIASLLVPVSIAASQAKTGWLSELAPALFRRGDPSLELLDWTSLAPGLARAGFGGARLVEGVNWMDCAKIAYALAPSTPVRCTTNDPRHFRYLPAVRTPADDIVVVRRARAFPAALGIPIARGGRVAFSVEAFTARAAADSSRCDSTEVRVPATRALPQAARRPFAAGERLEYSVSFLRFSVGSGVMQITNDTVRGQRTWRASFSIDGGFRFLSVHDTNTSWFDTTTFNSLRFIENLHEPRYHANRETDIYPERRVYHQHGQSEAPSVSDPLDAVSLVYFVRSLPLEPRECYELRRFYQPNGNPVVIHVLRRERITVPAGTYDAVVVRPEITTGGIFSQNGHAELWLSDDSARVVLQLKSHLPFGSINLYLRRISSEPPPGSGGVRPRSTR